MHRASATTVTAQRWLPFLLAAPTSLALLAAGDYRASAQMPSLEPVDVFGCVACAGPDLFGSIIAVSAGPGSSFAVLTREEPFVRLFNLDPPGARQFGRRGQGPGEFRFPFGIALLEDSVLVGHIRMGVSYELQPLGIDGAPSDAPPPLATRSEVRWLRSSPSGQWIAWIEQGGSVARVVRRNVATGAVDTLDVPPWVLEGSTDPRAHQYLSVAVSDSGTLAIGYGEVAYRVQLVGLNGATTRGGRLIPPRPYTDEELEERRRTRARIIGDVQRQRGRTPGSISEEQPEDPENHPFFLSNAFRFDSQDRLWVRAAPYRFSGIDGNTGFDLFDPTLRFLGELELGYFAWDWDVGGEFLVVATYGEMGIHQVRVSHIVENGGGGR